MDRRDFLKIGGLTIAAVAVPAGLASASPKSAAPAISQPHSKYWAEMIRADGRQGPVFPLPDNFLAELIESGKQTLEFSYTQGGSFAAFTALEVRRSAGTLFRAKLPHGLLTLTPGNTLHFQWPLTLVTG